MTNNGAARRIGEFATVSGHVYRSQIIFGRICRVFRRCALFRQQRAKIVGRKAGPQAVETNQSHAANNPNHEQKTLHPSRPRTHAPMQIVVFEDEQVALLAPITLGRPAFAISCGSRRLIDLLADLGCPVHAVVRPHLCALVAADFPQLASVGEDATAVPAAPTLWVNARLVPSAAAGRQLRQMVEAARPGVVLAGSTAETLAAAVVGPQQIAAGQGSVAGGKSPWRTRGAAGVDAGDSARRRAFGLQRSARRVARAPGDAGRPFGPADRQRPLPRSGRRRLRGRRRPAGPIRGDRLVGRSDRAGRGGVGWPDEFAELARPIWERTAA